MAVSNAGGWQKLFRTWQKFYYNLAGFNQLGLMFEDTLRKTPALEEAINRLPQDVYNERTFRLKRALDCSLKHRVLPKEQWTKFEEDVRYLTPYLNQIKEEMKEKKEWNMR